MNSLSGSFGVVGVIMAFFAIWVSEIDDIFKFIWGLIIVIAMIFIYLNNKIESIRKEIEKD